MRALILLLTISIAGVGAAGLTTARFGHAETESAKPTYRCPMHPTVRSDHPGECPICHMKLEQVKPGAMLKSVSATPAPSGERKIKFYRHPMNPSIHSDVPAKDDMGMDYIPVYETEPAGSAKTAVEGHGPVSLAPEQLKLSGAKLVRVARRDLDQEIRVPGRALGDGRVSFQMFEQDLAWIKAGLSFKAESPAMGDEPLLGKVTSVESILDPMTRTVRVNGSLSQAPARPLRAESSLTATILVRHPSVLVVPREAVLHSGSKEIVFVSGEDGVLEARQVALGARSGELIEIRSGLQEDETISSGPNFLLDSESKISASANAQ